MTKRKTWSRELAVSLMLFLCYLAYDGKTEEAAILVWPFTIFSMAAFGFKQPAVEDFMSRNRNEPS